MIPKAGSTFLSRVAAAQAASRRGNMSVTQALSESPEGKLMMLIQPSQRTPGLDSALQATSDARNEASRAIESADSRINEWAGQNRDQSRAPTAIECSALHPAALVPAYHSFGLLSPFNAILNALARNRVSRLAAVKARALLVGVTRALTKLTQDAEQLEKESQLVREALETEVRQLVDHVNLGRAEYRALSKILFKELEGIEFDTSFSIASLMEKIRVDGEQAGDDIQGLRQKLNQTRKEAEHAARVAAEKHRADAEVAAGLNAVGRQGLEPVINRQSTPCGVATRAKSSHADDDMNVATYRAVHRMPVGNRAAGSNQREPQEEPCPGGRQPQEEARGGGRRDDAAARGQTGQHFQS